MDLVAFRNAYAYKKISPDSELDLLKGIKWAREIGLDGLCITDHDSMGYKEKAQIIAREMEFQLLCLANNNFEKRTFVCTNFLIRV